jgi:hypothetical protein
MRTIVTNIYKYAELSKDAKRVAIAQFKDKSFYQAQEYMETIHSGLKVFDAELSDYRIDWQNGHFWFVIQHGMPKSVTRMKGEDLRNLIFNNYMDLVEFAYILTGFHADSYFVDPIIKTIEDNLDWTFEEMIHECVFEVIAEGIEDYIAQNTDAYINSYLMRNNYEFTESGILYKV